MLGQTHLRRDDIERSAKVQLLEHLGYVQCEVHDFAAVQACRLGRWRKHEKADRAGEQFGTVRP